MVARETVGRESAKSCRNLDKRQWELEVGYYFSNQFKRYYGGRIFRAGQLIRWRGGMNGALKEPVRMLGMYQSLYVPNFLGSSNLLFFLKVQ